MGDDDDSHDAVPLELGDELDLHAFDPRDLRDAVNAFLDHALAKGYATVRIIHGKGVGVQREAVRRVAERHEAVLRVRADEGGNWGVTLVDLRTVAPPGNA